MAQTATQPPPWSAPAWLRGGGASAAVSRYGMVSSVEEQATRAGVAVLEAGGNAVDAAIAVGYSLAVTHPSAGNLGGGGFMLIKMRDQPTVALDFRERAPLALTQSVFDQMIAEGARGARAVGVPGTVAGLQAAWKRFGTQPLAQLLAPAISLAKSHRLGARQALTLRWAWPTLRREPDFTARFGRYRGKQLLGPRREGDLVARPLLSRTLERIAEAGRDGFYAGPTAREWIAGLSARGGIQTLADLASYAAVWRMPLALGYRGAQVEVMPPPSAGGVAVQQMLAMLDRLDAAQYPAQSVENLHLFAEVAKRAHAERRFHVVDPDTVTNYDQAAHRARWADAQTWLDPFPIDLRTVTPASALHPLYAAAMAELDNTTHFSVADRFGNVVACTTTLSASFGAKLMVGTTGVIGNNSVAAFGTVGEDTPSPGRRMTSSMTPTLVSFNGRVILVLGSPGGDTIPNTVVQVLRNVVDYAMPLDEAIFALRIHHGFVPDKIRYELEHPPPPHTLTGLERLGHRFATGRRTIGDANDVMIIGEEFYGVADPREGGLALGPVDEGSSTTAAGELSAPPSSSPAQPGSE